MITHNELTELLSYDKNTGVFVWAVDKTNKAKKGAVAGSNAGDGYLQVRIDGKSYYQHRLAWFYVHGEWPEKEIDHINGDRSDNRIKNLRCVSKRGNARNRVMHPRNKSGVVGVHWDKKSNKWAAQIANGEKTEHLGLFDDLDSAALARQAAEKRLGYHNNHGRMTR